MSTSNSLEDSTKLNRACHDICRRRIQYRRAITHGTIAHPFNWASHPVGHMRPMSHGVVMYRWSAGLRAEVITVAPEVAWIVSQRASLGCHGILRPRGWRRPINKEHVRRWTSTL